MRTFVVALVVLLVPVLEAAAEAPPSFLRAWGSSGTLDAQFRLPNGIAVDNSGNVYVTDHELRVVKKFDVEGNFLRSWRAAGAPPQQGSGPTDVAVSPDGSVVYVSIQNVTAIQKYSSSGALLGTVGPVLEPTGLAVDSDGALYVADFGTHTVTKFASDGSPVAGWVIDPDDCAQLVDVAVDAARNIYVAEFGCNRVSKFGPDRQLLAQWGSAGSGEGQFNNARSVAVDAAGNVYASDWYNQRVQKFASTGAFLTTWGQPGSAAGQFGTLSPMNLAVGPNGDIYVCDRGNSRIQVFGTPPVPVNATSWGSVKATYR